MFLSEKWKDCVLQCEKPMRTTKKIEFLKSKMPCSCSSSPWRENKLLCSQYILEYKWFVGCQIAKMTGGVTGDFL